MPEVFDQGRVPVWLFRARPYDPAKGIERNVWFASEELATDEPHEGWLILDGSSDVVRIPDNSLLDLTSGFSIGVRFRTTVLQDASLVSKGLTSTGGAVTGGWFLGLLAGGSVRGSVADGGRSNADSAQSYADGEWHTLLYTFTAAGNLHQLWYDAFQVASVGTLVNVAANVIDVGIGAAFSIFATIQDEFEGDVERVVILDSVDSLTGHALLLSRDLTKSVADGGPVVNLVAAYPINEGYSTRIQDVSGNGHHGELDSSGGVSSKWSKIAPPPGTVDGFLDRPYSVSASLLRGGSRIGLAPHALPSFGSVGLYDPDGQVDYLARYNWDGRLTEHRLGFLGDPVTAYDVVWVGQADQPDDVSRTDFSVSIRSVDSVFRQEVQQDLYRSGYEPYFVGDGVDNAIDFVNVLNRGTGGLIIGTAIRTSTAGQNAAIYGKKNGTGAAAGYRLGLGSGGAIRFDLGDGVNAPAVAVNPTGGYESGIRIAVIGRVQRSTNTAFLYFNLYDGNGWQEVGTTDIAALGNLDNAGSLFAGRDQSAGGNHFNGEIERLVMSGSGSFADLQLVQAALDERYASDVDATPFIHYVALDENFGFTAADGSPSGFDGTISGAGDDDDLWSGTPNGTKDLEGKPKPFMRGRTSLNPARWVDNEKLVIQAMSGNFQNADVFSVREGFVPVSEAVPNSNNIFNTRPPAGTWRFQVGTYGGNTGVFIRFGSQPTGSITWSADYTDISINEAQFYPSTTFGVIALHVAGTLGGVLGQSDLQAAAPYVSGHYWDEPIRGVDALDEVLAGVGAYWTVDPRAPYDLNGALRPSVFQLRDLTGETPVATYVLDEDDELSDFAKNGFQQVGVSPAFRKVVVNYLRYRGFLSSGSEPTLVSSGPPPVHVPFKLVTELMQEWRSTQAPATDEEVEAVLDVFRDAEEHGVDSGMWFRKDARTEAQRVFDLFNRLTRTYRAELTGGLFTHWLGDVIAVRATRILSDPDAGEVTLLFMVVGVDDDANNSGSILDLWGGFELS